MRTSWQSLHAWLKWFRHGRRDGLRDRSRRPHTSPSQVPVEDEVAVCQLRQSTPKWGARRIAHELAARGLENAPGVRPCTACWSATAWSTTQA